MPEVELHHEDASAVDGAVVGVVKILDERLVTVATSLVRAGRGVPVDLPGGRYFIDGWSPAGDRFYGAIDTAEGRSWIHADGERPTEESATGWLQTWKFTGRSWSVGSPPQLRDGEIECVDCEGSAVVWATEGGAPKVFVVPPETRLEITGEGMALASGAAATLVGYLHRGDRSSARPVAKEIQAGGSGSDRTADIAAAYYLVRTGHPDARAWVAELTWAYPDVVDVIALDAHLKLRDGDPRAAVALRRAATSGLPFVGDGLRLLSADLDAAGEASFIRPYLLAQLNTALTSFWGESPAVPQRAAAAPSAGRPICSMTWPVAPQRPKLPRRQVASPPTTAFNDRLAAALRSLQDLNVGLRPSERQVVVADDDLEVSAVVEHGGRQGRFDLDVFCRAPEDLNGVVVAVRELGAVRLGVFDERDVCSFRGLRPGRWTFTLCDRRQDSPLTWPTVLPLPVVQPAMDVLAAAGDNLDEVLRATTPTGTTVLVLRRDRDSGFYLEAVRQSGQELLAIGVEYGNTSGDTVLTVAPYPVNESGRRGVQIDLGDFDVTARWQVSEALEIPDLARMEPDDLAPSLLRPLTNGVRDAWRTMAARLPEPHRNLIDRLVG